MLVLRGRIREENNKQLKAGVRKAARADDPRQQVH